MGKHFQYFRGDNLGAHLQTGKCPVSSMLFLCCKVKSDQFIKRVLRNKSKHAKKDFTHGLNRGDVKFCLRLKLFQAVLNILKCLAHLMNYTVVVTVRILGIRRYKEQH